MTIRSIEIRDSAGWIIGMIFGPRTWAIEPYLAVKYIDNSNKEAAFNSIAEAKEWIES